MREKRYQMMNTVAARSCSDGLVGATVAEGKERLSGKRDQRRLPLLPALEVPFAAGSLPQFDVERKEAMNSVLGRLRRGEDKKRERERPKGKELPLPLVRFCRGEDEGEQSILGGLEWIGRSHSCSNEREGEQSIPGVPRRGRRSSRIREKKRIYRESERLAEEAETGSDLPPLCGGLRWV
uniref:Uncharacterized protein n=1 Tax=Nelumbo nucifera TaxID=4432 RepID=A0A822XVG8_NELNU|nr:TPA_asm: hypothetical protein HUJ06_025804 [Nelumbo nucifera]